MSRHETVRPASYPQARDIIATVVGAIPELSFEEAQALIGNKGQFLEGIRAAFKPFQKTLQFTHVIECNTPPRCPRGAGWKVEEHRKHGKLRLTPRRVQLHVPRKLENSTLSVGDIYRDQLQNRDVVNANVLDFFLKNLNSVPKEFEEHEAILFFGTVYIDDGDDPYVRCLVRSAGKWKEDRFCFESYWQWSWAAAVLVPQAPLAV